MKRKRKGLSTLLAVSLLLGSIGFPGYAADLEERTIQLGTESLDSVVEEIMMLPDKHYNPQDYLYLGKAGNQPLKWRVLDAEKNNAGENTGVFLLSETVLDTVQFDADETANEGQTDPHEWQNSDIADWYQNTLTGTTYFTQSELDGLQAINKTEPAQTGKFTYPLEENTLENEKLFAPSIPELWDYVSTYRGFSGLVARDVDGVAQGWWTRSPVGNNPLQAMMFSTNGWHYYVKVSAEWGARPATNIAKNAVLFSSQAVGGKKLENSLGLENVEYGSVTEWKLTLLDSTRQFTLQEQAKEVEAGESITLTYSGAKTGDKEYISALLVKAGEVLSYGRILQPTQTSGSVTIDLPDTLTDGVYSLHVFNEEYNGGEEDDSKFTDYASAFSTVTLTVGEGNPDGGGEEVDPPSGGEEVQTFTISLNLDGGTGISNLSLTVEEGESLYEQLKLLTPEKENFTFMGWFIIENGVEGSQITQGTDVTVTANLTVTAKWEAVAATDQELEALLEQAATLLSEIDTLATKASEFTTESYSTLESKATWLRQEKEKGELADKTTLPTLMEEVRTAKASLKSKALADALAKETLYSSEEYTEETYQVFIDAIEAGKQAMNGTANIEDQKAKAAAIEEAITKLAPKPTPDPDPGESGEEKDEELEALLEQAATLLSEIDTLGTKASEFTTESYSTLESKATWLRQEKEKGDLADKTTLSTLMEEVRSAKASLKSKALADALAKETLYSSEEYTEETYQVFIDAIEAGKQAMNGTANIEDQKAKAAAIEEAITKLAPKPIPDPGTEDIIVEGIWLADIKDDLVYNGAKQTQSFRLFDGETLLEEKKDYTVTYKNNTNAYLFEKANSDIEEDINLGYTLQSIDNVSISGTLDEAETVEAAKITEDMKKKAPQMIIKLKGNYKGTITVYFEIAPISLNSSEIEAADLFTIYNGKEQKPKPQIFWKGKKLTAKDFVVEAVGENDYKGKEKKGTENTLMITGQGNFSGQREMKYYICPRGGGLSWVTMNKVSVSKVTDLNFLQEAAESTEGMVQSGYGVMHGGKEVNPAEYTVVYKENKKVGTATMVLTGTSSDEDGDGKVFVGTKRITFKIKGNSMSKVKVEGLASYTYTGNPITPLVAGETGKVQVTLNGKPVDPEAYTIDYQNNTNKGTATLILTGIEEKGFTGVKKQTFKIVSDTIVTGEDKFAVAIIDEAQVAGDIDEEVKMPFTKGGVKPAIEVKDPSGKVLKADVDYTVSYRNNTKLAKYSDGKKAPAVVVKGKGNYTGTVEETFTIIQKDVEEGVNSDDITVVAADKVVNFKNKGWKSTFKVLDQNGKALGGGDTELKKAVYTIDALPSSEGIENYEELLNYKTNATQIPDTAKLPAGTVIRITVELKGDFYKGTVSGIYRILEEGKDISKFTFKIKDQAYTGDEICLDETSQFSKIQYKKQEVSLVLEQTIGQSLEVVEGSYVKNVNKGTAKVTLRGVGEYGGTKTVSFKIVERNVKDNNNFNAIFKGLIDIFAE